MGDLIKNTKLFFQENVFQYVVCKMAIILSKMKCVNVIWWYRSGSTLAQVMACCLTAPSHYLNQCWFLMSEVLWHSCEGNFVVNTRSTDKWNEFKKKIVFPELPEHRPGVNEFTASEKCYKTHISILMSCFVTTSMMQPLMTMQPFPPQNMQRKVPRIAMDNNTYLKCRWLTCPFF